MPRLARLDATSVLHHVMICGIERRKIFRDNKDQEDFIERLSRLLPESETACYGWSIMTNHALCGAPHKACYVKFRRCWISDFNETIAYRICGQVQPSA